MDKINYLSPRFFILGLLFGLLLCSMAGRYISTKDSFEHFSRFFNQISPESLYYPTASEMLATIRKEVPRDKILILVGGSSVFRGTGQDLKDLWSTKLQKKLGSQFKVINYATDAGTSLSYGGILFRMLRAEYPKIIYVVTTRPFNGQGRIDGLEPYDYLFWDAYYKKLFKPTAFELQTINDLQKKELADPKKFEIHVISKLDSFFYFRDLWNWVGYRYFFTLWSDYQYRHPFQARLHCKEIPTDPNYKKLLFTLSRKPESLKSNSSIVAGEANYLEHGNGGKIKISVLQPAIQNYEDNFSKPDRKKILFVQTMFNPLLLYNIPEEKQKDFFRVVSKSSQMIKSLGYQELDVGLGFSPNDYLDCSHFQASGGEKLAGMLAIKIRQIVNENGFAKT